jgi:flagellar biosynthesis protein FliQ
MSIANVTQRSGTQTSPTAHRKSLLLSAVLLLSSFIVGEVVSLFHAGGLTDPNNHPAVFVLYAQSGIWTTVHLAQFIVTAATIGGLLVLFHALNLPDGMPRLVARIGIVSGGVALALTAMLYAVDGVVLKRAVDAWVSAPDAEKAVRFASAETVRWLEEATGSYEYFLIGLTLILLAALIVWTARVPRPIGYLLGLTGVTYFVAGWIHGVAGFVPQAAIPFLLGVLSLLISSVWLLIAAWRMPDAAEIAPGSGSPTRRNDAGAAATSR